MGAELECIDEIADATGKKAEVAAITEATMRGEITDFKDSLRQRVGKLVGVTEADMARVLAERLSFQRRTSSRRSRPPSVMETLASLRPCAAARLPRFQRPWP